MLIGSIRVLVAFGALSVLAVAQSVSQPQRQAPAKTSQKSQMPEKKPPDGHLVRVQTISSPSEMADFLWLLKCDGDGNLYLSTGPDVDSGVHKLNAKGERVAVFQASSNPDMKVDFTADFTFEADGGELYQLAYPHEVNRYVFIYESDGKFKSAVKLKPGFPFSPKQLAVFPSGQFLVSGEEWDKNPSDTRWPFTGIFAADGSLLKELELEDDKALHDMAAAGDTRVARPGIPRANRAIDNGHVEMGADGNAYLMRWTNPAIFYAISPGGEMVRRFTVDPGESAYRVSAVHAHKNRIAVLFVSRDSNLIMKVVDLEGHEIATYDEAKVDGKPANALSSPAFACYTENPTRFVFVGADDNSKLQLWIVEPR